MPATDAPDWQEVVVTVPETGAVPDSPDWQNTVVGPGGSPVGPSPGAGPGNPYGAAGYLGVTADPSAVQSATGHEEGVVALMVFTALGSFTANYITFPISGTGGLTAHQNYLGIYDVGQTTASTFTLLATTASGTCDTAFAATGSEKVQLSSGAALVGGQNYAVALLNNGAAPTFAYASSISTPAVNPEGSTYPFRSYTTATFTTLPATITFSAVTLTFAQWLFFVSNT